MTLAVKVALNPNRTNQPTIISSPNAMFEASSVYFQCLNELAAHVKIDRVSRWDRHGP